MDYTNSLNDETIAQTGSNFLGGVVDKMTGWLNGQGDSGITQITGTPPQPTSSASESPTAQGQINNPQSGSILSSVKQVNPLLLGGIAAGILWFATKRPLLTGLAGAGVWFFTDKMNKGA